MELHLFARLRARPGQRDAVREAIERVRGPTRGETGCLDYAAYQSVRDADEFHIHSRWRDRAAFERHATLPHTIAFVAEVEPLLDVPLAVSLARPLA